ncbi:MAG: hypothetical protein AAGJ70_02410 [Pseudomonadota bacterium]
MGLVGTAAEASSPARMMITATREVVEHQIAFYEIMMKQAPMAAFLRQQAMMIDMALSVFREQRRLRRQR